MLESMDLLEVSPQTVYASVHAVMTLLLAAEGMSHNDYQKRELFSVNALSKSLKSIRQYFTSRHSGK